MLAFNSPTVESSSGNAASVEWQPQQVEDFYKIQYKNERKKKTAMCVLFVLFCFGLAWFSFVLGICYPIVLEHSGGKKTAYSRKSKYHAKIWKKLL